MAAAALRPAGIALSRPPELRDCAARRRDRGGSRRPAGDRDRTPGSSVTAICSRARIASPMCCTGAGLVPGNRVLLRGYNSPELYACLARRDEDGRDRGHDDANAARTGTDLDHRQGRSRPSRSATSGWSAELKGGRDDRRRRRRSSPGVTAISKRAWRRLPTASSTWTRRPTTSACSHSPRARPASPRPACIFIATCSRWPMSSRGTCCTRAGGCLRRQPAARLHLRARGAAGFSAALPRGGRADRGAGARGGARGDRASQGDLPLHRAIRLSRADAAELAGRDIGFAASAACRPANSCRRPSRTPGTR